jgi:hypothetical protein
MNFMEKACGFRTTSRFSFNVVVRVERELRELGYSLYTPQSGQLIPNSLSKGFQCAIATFKEL